MAKYTNNDPDIKYLDLYDQTNYNFELLKYDVDSRQEARTGVTSVGFLFDMKKLKDMFKSPTNFKLGFITLITILLVIVIAIFIILYIVLKLLPKILDKDPDIYSIQIHLMNKAVIYIILPIIILILIYWFFNKINQQTRETGKNIKI